MKGVNKWFTSDDPGDFVQRGDAINELTVTITLCEYRRLVADTREYALLVDRLNEEKADLEKKLKSASEALAACQMPEWVRSIGNTLAHWGENNAEEQEDEP